MLHLVLEGDKKLSKVVLELGALLQVALELEEGVVSGRPLFQQLLASRLAVDTYIHKWD